MTDAKHTPLEQKLMAALEELLDYADDEAILIADSVPREFRAHVHMAFIDARAVLDEARGEVVSA